jgi:hypothetical protein
MPRLGCERRLGSLALQSAASLTEDAALARLDLEDKAGKVRRYGALPVQL